MTASNDESSTCARGTLVLSTRDAQRLVPALCRRWACAGCGRRKARRLARRIALVRARRFITLTVRPIPGEPLPEAIDRVNRGWRLLWKRVKREHPEYGYGYVKVVELTKSGTPHLHILADTPYLPQWWLAKNWRELTGSYIVDIRKVEGPQQVAKYVAKYLTKGHSYDSPRRRWSQSKGFVPPEPAPELEPGELPLVWKYRHVPLEEFARYLVATGAVLRDGWYWWDPAPPTGAGPHGPPVPPESAP